MGLLTAAGLSLCLLLSIVLLPALLRLLDGNDEGRKEATDPHR
jgi:predicted RND superfamily exporter protein